jgi:hypothetical protein
VTAFSTRALVEASQPFLDLFEVGLTPMNVKDFGYSHEGTAPHIFATEFVTDGTGLRVGEVTHRLYHSHSVPVVE